jgi:hypothetical protein
MYAFGVCVRMGGSEPTGLEVVGLPGVKLNRAYGKLEDDADNSQNHLPIHASSSLGLCIYAVVVVEYSIFLALLPPGQMTFPDLWSETPSHAM